MRRSKSYERPARPRTPERKWTRNARHLVDKTKKNHVYATPIRKKQLEPPIIEEFVEEVPRYVRPLMEEKEAAEGPVIDLSTEVEFSSKVGRGQLAREDSLTTMLKRELSKKERALPEYVEPKDPIIRELQEFLKIEPKEGSQNGSNNSTSNTINSNGTVIEEEKEVSVGS